jgi:hypothetical protein
MLFWRRITQDFRPHHNVDKTRVLPLAPYRRRQAQRKMSRDSGSRMKLQSGHLVKEGKLAARDQRQQQNNNSKTSKNSSKRVNFDAGWLLLTDKGLIRLGAEGLSHSLSHYLIHVETVWLRWSDLLMAGMWILCEELCSSRTHVT